MALSIFGKYIFGASFNASLVHQRDRLFLRLTRASTLHFLLDVTQKAKYTDELDRIYALLGLAPPEFRANIAVDYSQPVFDLFYNTCVTMTNLRNGLVFLRFCDWEPGTPQAKPTWVPDWNRNELQILPDSWFDGKTTLSRNYSIDGPQLKVQAIFYEKVQYVATTDVGCVDTLLSLTKMAEELNENPCLHQTIDVLKRELNVALTSGRVRDFHPDATFFGTVDEFLNQSDD